MPIPVKVQYVGQHIKIRERNKVIYRVSHWPIWIWVFFLAPGPLTFDLFEQGPTVPNMAWLVAVLIGHRDRGDSRASSRALSPRLTFCASPKTARIRSTGKVCYTFAWSDVDHFCAR